MPEDLPEGGDVFVPARTPEPKPDFAKYQGILGLVVGLAFTLYLADGGELNWKISIFIYLAILVFAIWSFLTHAAPHWSVSRRVGGVIIYVLLIGGMGFYGSRKQYQLEHPKAPNLPQIALDTINGYPFGTQPNPNLRWNNLSIRNASDVDIFNLRCRLQLPEAIVETSPVNKMAGVNVEWSPEFINPIVVSGTVSRGSNGGISLGGHSAIETPINGSQFNRPYKHGTMSIFSGAETGGGNATGIWELNLDRLPSNYSVNVEFITSSTETNYNGIWFSPNYTNSDMRFYLEGEYQFKSNTVMVSQYFFSPITFDEGQRKLSISETRKDFGTNTLVIMQFH
jgi:hypothetical protein